MAERRKDSKNRVLRNGESQRKDGTYMYRYTDVRGKRVCVYARTLEDLRVKEQTIQKELNDGIDYAAGEIIRLAEGSLATVSCLKGEKNGCEKAGHCRALPLWEGLDQVIDQYLDSVSLADLQKVEETP